MCADGSRQFCFAFHEKIDAYLAADDPPWELESEAAAVTEQKRIDFPGAMPEKPVRQPSLFESAA
jgi:hypothetical protein